VTEAWQRSDSAASFVQALAARGYMLATGKRPYLVVDLYGGVNALPRLIDDKAVRSKDVQALLGKDVPPESLPTAEEAQALVAKHRQVIDKGISEDRRADALAALQHQQGTRRAGLVSARAALDRQQKDASALQQRQHRAARDELRRRYLDTKKAIDRARHENRPTGLAAFLGRITGVDLVRKALHRHQDAQRQKTYGVQLSELKAGQSSAQRALDREHQTRAADLARQEASLDKVERRERASLLRDLRTEQRIRSRGEAGVMPSLAPARETAAWKSEPAPDVLTAFGQTKRPAQNEMPDLMSAFERATRGPRADGSADGNGRALEGFLPQGVGPDATPERKR
jgi:hypothetical protein